jgi:hypothetical protein
MAWLGFEAAVVGRCRETHRHDGEDPRTCRATHTLSRGSSNRPFALHGDPEPEDRLCIDGRFRWRIGACCIGVEPGVRRVLVDGIVI